MHLHKDAGACVAFIRRNVILAHLISRDPRFGGGMYWIPNLVILKVSYPFIKHGTIPLQMRQLIDTLTKSVDEIN